MFSNFFVLGHRGMGKDHRVYPENTLESFKEAYKLTNYCECDVRKTKDGVVIVYHDHGFDRMSKKYRSRMVKDCNWKDLKDLEVFSRERKGNIPLLTDLLDLVSLDQNRVIFIELKENIGKEVIEIIRSHSNRDVEGQINIISQHLSFLESPLSLSFPEIGFISRDKLYLSDTSPKLDILRKITNIGFSYYAMDESYFGTFKKKTGIRNIWVWNPYKENDIKRMKEIGVIGMGSNDIPNTLKCLIRIK